MKSPLPSETVLVEAIVKVLRTSNSPMNIKEMEMKVASEIGITNVILDSYKRSNNRSEFAYRLAWSRSRAKKLGLIERVGHSTWKATSVIGENRI